VRRVPRLALGRSGRANEFGGARTTYLGARQSIVVAAAGPAEEKSHADGEHPKCGARRTRLQGLHGASDVAQVNADTGLDISAKQAFVARQPLFDLGGGVVGYELLFRSGLKNEFPRGFDTTTASARVIKDLLLVFGFETLTEDKLAFVNVTADVLGQRLYSVLPPGRTVLEILETENASPMVVAACREAKRAGFRLALDGFVLNANTLPLVELADMIKIDVLATPHDERRRIMKATAGRARVFVAAKIETREAFELAVADGHTYFQGFFLARPELIARRNIAPGRLMHLELMRELQRDDLDLDRIERIIKRDVSLAMALLRFLNSGASGWRDRVTSVRRAIVMLGERGFRHWASLVGMLSPAPRAHDGVLTVSLACARFCELLAPRVLGEGQEFEAFLSGMLSRMDTITGRSLSDILQEVGASQEVTDAVVEPTSSGLGTLLRLCRAYERGAWAELDALSADLGLPEDAVHAAYLEAVGWTTEALTQS
jgi:c-di-GMP-related signal transduction protein